MINIYLLMQIQFLILHQVYSLFFNLHHLLLLILIIFHHVLNQHFYIQLLVLPSYFLLFSILPPFFMLLLLFLFYLMDKIIFNKMAHIYQKHIHVLNFLKLSIHFNIHFNPLMMYLDLFFLFLNIMLLNMLFNSYPIHKLLPF